MASFRAGLCVAAVLFFAAVQLGSTLQCYSCESKEKCAVNATTLPKVTCTGTDPVCVQIDDSNGDAVERGCLTQARCDLFNECASCSEDLCNSPSSTAVPSFFAITLVAAVFAKYYCL